MSDEDEAPKEVPRYNQTPFHYDIDNETETFGDRRKAAKLSPAVVAPTEAELSKLTPREAKLAELRAKKAAVKRATTEAVIEEDRREKNPEQEAKRQKLAAAAKKEQERERDRLLGIDQGKKKVLNTTAQDHANYEKRKKEKQAQSGWGSLLDEETQGKIYERRMKDFKFSEKDYQRQKERLGEDDFYRDGHNLTYGQTTGVTVGGVNRMVEEMEKQADRRSKWSRRRAHQEDADITYINERNKNFNEKVDRSYNKYAVTLKQNLERGTAV